MAKGGRAVNKKSAKKIKSLAAKKVSLQENRRIKGGYIGETEKLRAGGVRDGTSNT
jgi:hypothetical protein